MFLDCDYLVGSNAIFGVIGTWPTGTTQLIAKRVYERRNGRWVKCAICYDHGVERVEAVDPRGLSHRSSRGQVTLDVLAALPMFAPLHDALVEIGIDPAEIGYFGSARLVDVLDQGHPIKDLDLVVYGRRAFRLVRDRKGELYRRANVTAISAVHVERQLEKRGAAYLVGDLRSCLRRKWSSCQVSPTVCSTIRFVDPAEITADLVTRCVADHPADADRTLTGRIVNSDGCSFQPRRFTLDTGTSAVEVASIAWVFHQAVKEGTMTTVTGAWDGRFLILNDGWRHGIRS